MQTFRDWELIVVDDGSTDGTWADLTMLHDPRIRPVFLTHGASPARARAAAVTLARGEWVAFLDSDDIWVANKLALQLEQLAQRPSCRWSYSRYDLVDLHASPAKLPGRRPDTAPSGWILDGLLTFQVSASITTLVVRRSLLDEVGGIDETIGIRDDYDLTLRLAARSEVLAIPDRLTVVRHHAGRTTAHRRPWELFRDNARVFRKAAMAASSESVQRLCTRQCAVQLAWMARGLSEDRQHRAAFLALTRALKMAPLSGAVWRATVGCALNVVRRSPWP
jgi:glycosyltransferase involved in cell wall biosynthesis